MKRRGHTLVELMAALAAAALVVLVAGRLLFDGLESWRRQADTDTAQRQAMLTLDALADDLAAQPDFPTLPQPVETFTLDEGTTRIAFFIAGNDLRPRSVCWYKEGDGAGLWALRRIESAEDEAEAALPANAAEQAVAAALPAPESEAAKALRTASRRMCSGLVELRLETPAGVPGPQLLLDSLTPEGQTRLQNGEALNALPQKLRLRSARPPPT
ncbi:MAG: prepilin-type N-terminal cleavage/methylation domain-containing protein, partial [Opitutales bacterium]